MCRAAELKGETVDSAIERLRLNIEGHDFAGYDPYDALNSRLCRTLACGNKYARTALIQAVKRCPLNLRPVLGIPRGHNPKGIGLFLWGYAKLYKFYRNPEYTERIEHLLLLLERLKSPGYHGNCWGYNFDWQSRAFFAPKYTPTIVNSAFIGHALLDTYAYTQVNRALEMAMSIKDFMVQDLNTYKDNGSQCFSYTPLDNSRIYNATMLGASLLIRLFEITGDEDLKETARASLEYGIRDQRADGSWYYGPGLNHRWIDSFHTGFNLQSIYYFIQAGFEEYRAAFENGMDFYVRNFFLQDGTPKYYHDRIYPIDIHSPCQGIALLSMLAPKYNELAGRLAEWMLANLYDQEGRFYFQKTRWYTNRVVYMRWSQAWAFHALTSFLAEMGSTPE